MRKHGALTVLVKQLGQLDGLGRCSKTKQGGNQGAINVARTEMKNGSQPCGL
jgi:hypothetical protein